MAQFGETGTDQVSKALEERPQGLVARVTIARPEKRNAISPAVAAGLAAAFEGLALEDSLRAVVLTGAGERAFSAGADITAMQGLDPAGARAFITGLHRAIAAVRACPVPVIGRLRGHCLGGALELAAACDLRVGDESVVIGMPEVRVGVPSVIEAALLPGLIGWGKTREMLLLGGTYDARESYRMGLLQKLVAAEALDAAVEAWIGQILANGPRALRQQKALMAEWERLDLAESIDAGIDAFSAAFKSDEPGRLMAPYVKAAKPRTSRA